MFKVLLGAWAFAGVLTGGLLTAVTQNTPPLPNDEAAASDTRESQAGEPTDAQSEREMPEDGVPREGDTTQLEQEAARDQREVRDRQEPVKGEPSDAASDQQPAVPGATGAEAINELKVQFRTSNSGRLMVSSTGSAVPEGSGLREGDVIVSAGGRTFDSEPALREFLVREAKRDQIPFVVVRDGREITVSWDRNTPERAGSGPGTEAVAGSDRLDRPRRAQRRQAARPDFDTAQRVEQLERRVDALQKDLEQLRHRLNAVLGNEPASGERTNGSARTNGTGLNGAEQSPASTQNQATDTP